MRATTDAVRAWLEASKEYEISLMDFLDSFKNDYELFNAIESIEEGYITWSLLLAGDFVVSGSRYYDSYEYVISHDGYAIDAHYAEWCHGYDGYVDSSSDYVIEVYIHGGGTRIYSESYIIGGSYDFIYFNGDYYEEDSLSWYDIVYLHDIEEHGYADANFQHSDGYWYSEPEERYIRSYHSYNRPSQDKVEFTDFPQAFVGIEIEKEDFDVREATTIHEFEDECEGWVKEADASLDDDTGFECVSPPMELIPDKIMDYIEGMPSLVDIVNADYSSNCGGHIHLSVDGFDGEGLFDHIKGYTPLLHALYPKRGEMNYSKAKNNSRLKSERGKYQSINILTNRIEIRIFPAIRNMTNLKWRLKLIELMLKHPTDCPAQAFYNFHAHFMPHIKQVYNEDERLRKLNDRLINYTADFEEIQVEIPKFSALAAA